MTTVDDAEAEAGPAASAALPVEPAGAAAVALAASLDPALLGVLSIPLAELGLALCLLYAELLAQLPILLREDPLLVRARRQPTHLVQVGVAQLLLLFRDPRRLLLCQPRCLLCG